MVAIDSQYRVGGVLRYRDYAELKSNGSTRREKFQSGNTMWGIFFFEKLYDNPTCEIHFLWFRAWHKISNKKNLARIVHRMLELSPLHRLSSSIAFSPTVHESDDPVRWYRSHYVGTTRKGKWSLPTHSTESVACFRTEITWSWNVTGRRDERRVQMVNITWGIYF